MFRTLINQIPPHEAYIEPFLGHGAILLNKRPAILNLGIDIDPEVITSWHNRGFSEDRKFSSLDSLPASKFHLSIKIGDAIECLKKCYLDWKTFVYCDPPYILSTRKSGPRYKHEFSNEQHIELLKLLTSLDCMVMISGYRHDIYDEALGGWRRIDYQASTRQGIVNESAWMNYPEPTELHDYRYLGNNYREREKIGRQIFRWVSRLHAMPILQRRAILAAITAENIDKDLSSSL